MLTVVNDIKTVELKQVCQEVFIIDHVSTVNVNWVLTIDDETLEADTSVVLCY